MSEQSNSQVLFGSVIAILIIIQLVSVVYLWSLSTVGLSAERLFALFLGVDVLSFAMVSYSYRSYRKDESPKALWLGIGAIILVMLMVSGFVL